MIRLYSWIILFSLGVFAQENNIYRSVSSTLKECYENKYLLEKDNRLPHTLNILIAILQKIEEENRQDFFDLRTSTVGIMHRFRQDGIEKNPTVVEQSGVLPYRAAAQAQKYIVIARFIPEKTNFHTYNTLTDIERCTLHFMLSSSIERFERGDENKVCSKYADNVYRSARSMTRTSSNTNLDVHDDVETLTPEQIDVITNNKNGLIEHVFPPNALYPELPPNHPKIARILNQLPSLSRCPVENGVIKTIWGPVSAGPLIAGIAAGLQPENIKLSDIFPEEKNEERKANLSRLFLDNKWLATVAGDLAEVTLLQGPINEKINVGANGMWNSSAMPRWYFLRSSQKLHFTTAEVRGDIDGLILANEIEALYSKVPTLRLSQILDLYYSPRGLFKPSIRACNRRVIFQTIIPKPTMSAQAYSASLVLEEHLHKATINDDRMQEFAAQATDELSNYVHNSMNEDLTCQETETGDFNDVTQVAIDLTIILDTTWSFNDIQAIIAQILDNIKINRYNSQFTIINGYDGSVMINTTSSILDFARYNITHYNNVTNKGFDFSKSLNKLRMLQTKKLNDERHGLGQAKSDVVLIIPHTSSPSESDKPYQIEQIKQMREKVPDATLLILTHGSKDSWTDFVRDPLNDLFSIAMGDAGSSTAIAKLISRIKQVPQRLINTQCGADYSPVGSSNSFIDYIEPATIVSYRMHPNYFFSTNSEHVSKIKIEGSGWGNLRVCTSRHFVNINVTSNSCESINSNEHTITFSCGDASLIHLCEPLYLTIIANSSSINYQCTDPKCRFPHMIKYTVSYENLVCENSANINILNIFVLIISTIYIFL